MFVPQFPAVQHERGPRKPKLHLMSGGGAPGTNHHHHIHHHHSNSNNPSHSNLLHGNHHPIGALSDSNHPLHLPLHHNSHIHLQPQMPNGHAANNHGALITNVSASFNYTAHLNNSHHHHLQPHHHHPHPNHQPQFAPNFHHHPANIQIHHPQPLPFSSSPLNGGGSLLAPQKLESNHSSAFEVPPLTIKHSTSDQESHYTRKSDEEESAISPTHTIKSSTSPGLSSPEQITLVDQPADTLRSSTTSNGVHREDTTSPPRPPTVAMINETTPPPGQRQTDLLEILMRSDKCQEFLQYQMQNSLFFPQSTFWPAPPPLLPLPTSSSGGGATAAGGLISPASGTVPPPAHLPSWEILQETTARLLFMAVRWVRCLVPFQTLSKADQHLLLQVRYARGGKEYFFC